MAFGFRLLSVALAIGTVSTSVRAAELRSGAETRRAFSVQLVGSGRRPMILVPGLLSAGDVWESVIIHFVPLYRIQVVRLVGFAGVPPLAETDNSLSLLSQVWDDLIAYVREERLEKPVLIGHSPGAMLALCLASTEPASTRNTVLVADRALHFVTLDDPAFLLAAMDEFFIEDARR